MGELKTSSLHTRIRSADPLYFHVHQQAIRVTFRYMSLCKFLWISSAIVLKYVTFHITPKFSGCPKWYPLSLDDRQGYVKALVLICSSLYNATNRCTDFSVNEIGLRIR
jgi:hypothetical protein